MLVTTVILLLSGKCGLGNKMIKLNDAFDYDPRKTLKIILDRFRTSEFLIYVGP